MLATGWRPFGMTWQEMNRLREKMEQRFRRAEANDPDPFAQSVYPPLNLWEDEHNLYVEAELPGLELSDLELLVNGDNQLSIIGERKRPKREDGAWRRQERGHGNFSRACELPQYVDADTVTAQFLHGVLTVTLPKREEEKSRRIEVEAS